MNSFWMPKKQPLYAPMLSSFGGGSARGFNPGGEPRIIGVVQQGFAGATLTDAQSGDLIIAATGSLVNNANTLLSGYTSISSNTSSTQWSPSSPNYYVMGRLQYRLLNGTETTVPSGITDGGGVFIQYRFAKKVTSVSTQNVINARAVALSGSYFSTASASNAGAGTLRVNAAGAYGGGGNAVLSTGSPQYSQDSSYGKLLITETTSSGTLSREGASFAGACFYATILCNG